MTVERLKGGFIEKHSHSLICRSLYCVDKIWEKIVIEEISSWMRKNYGWEHVAEGEVGGSKISPYFPVCVSISKCHETGQRDL